MILLNYYCSQPSNTRTRCATCPPSTSPSTRCSQTRYLLCILIRLADTLLIPTMILYRTSTTLSGGSTTNVRQTIVDKLETTNREEVTWLMITVTTLVLLVVCGVMVRGAIQLLKDHMESSTVLRDRWVAVTISFMLPCLNYFTPFLTCLLISSSFLS